MSQRIAPKSGWHVGCKLELIGIATFHPSGCATMRINNQAGKTWVAVLIWMSLGITGYAAALDSPQRAGGSAAPAVRKRDGSSGRESCSCEAAEFNRYHDRQARRRTDYPGGWRDIPQRLRRGRCAGSRSTFHAGRGDDRRDRRAHQGPAHDSGFLRDHVPRTKRREDRNR